MLQGYSYLPESGNVKKAVIFLHGFGADGQDLISLAEFYSKALPNTVFYSPDAPDPTPFHMGYQWFNLTEEITFTDKEGITNSKIKIENFIDSIVLKHKIDYKDVAVIGFSQGTMMSLYTAPRMKNKIAGLVGFSGAIMYPEELKDTEYNKLPILLYHGKNDPTVDYTKSQETEKELEKLEFFDVELIIEDGLEHGISMSGIEKSSKFLKRVLFTD